MSASSKSIWGVRTAMLKVANINQYYGGAHILRDVSFEATRGKVSVVLGRNGVGKTTLLKSLMGLVPIKTGSIVFNGQPIERATPYERARAGIGFVPQGREIFPRLSVADNLRMGLACRSAATPIPAELFDLFPVLKQMLQRRGGDLSGGQQQHLAIARALAAGYWRGGRVATCRQMLSGGWWPFDCKQYRSSTRRCTARRSTSRLGRRALRRPDAW